VRFRVGAFCVFGGAWCVVCSLAGSLAFCHSGQK